ncbi:MAG: mechanosensitive ion channel family protein, partial [bacterium]|nr:mechanosensitive ion channel family protein [bacterium]
MQLTIHQLILPSIFILSGIILGLIFKKIIISKLKKIAAKTKWHGDEILVNELRNMPLLWFIIGGIYVAILTI